jgi:hypothetical protein
MASKRAKTKKHIPKRTKGREIAEYAQKIKTWSVTSIWAFPVILLFVFLILTTLRISGTSVGVYPKMLYGQEVKDPDLLYGTPRTIRSDEWLGTTQIIVSQSKEGYPRISKNLGTGRDLILTTEIPFRHWTLAFKPHMWSFFVMPLEYAFAFKWWLLSYAVIVSCYLFVMRIFSNKKLFSIIFSLAIGLSPFLLWWYQSASSLAIALGFLIVVMGMRIIDRSKVRFVNSERLALLLQIGLLAYLLTCFGLLLYPPFLIPIALVTIFYLVGYALQKNASDKLSTNIKKSMAAMSPLFISAGIAMVFGLLYVATSREIIETLTNTLYPGARVVSSGDLRILNVLDAFLMPQLQRESGVHLPSNQSEASNFILLMPFLLLPGIALLIYEYRKLKKIDWILLLLTLCSLIFLARAFIPVGDPLYKLLLLHKVPNIRLVIGIGFVGIFYTVYLVKKLEELKANKKLLALLAGTYGLACFITLLWMGFFVVEHYPLFIRSRRLIIALAISFVSIIVLFLAKRRMIAVSLLLAFSIISSYQINPLYKGLGFVKNGELVRRISEVSNPNDRWVVVDNIQYDSFPINADRPTLSGAQLYPDIEFWRKAGGTQYDDMYNREGHIVYSSDPDIEGPFRLVQKNYLQVKFTCSDFIKDTVNFALATHPLELQCISLADTVSYPNTTFYLYKVVR